jgi:hypothetical protein
MKPKDVNVGKEVAALERMTVKQLKERYGQVFGESTTANNRTWLFKRIVWRLQALAEGDLSERARARATELARDADLRLNPPVAKAAATPPGQRTREGRCEADGRLPPPGTIITRKYKGGMVQVKVLADGFEYAGEVYRSLSAVAKAVTGSHCNGFLFFRLRGKESAA